MFFSEKRPPKDIPPTISIDIPPAEEGLSKLHCTIKAVKRLNIVAYNNEDKEEGNNNASNYLLNDNNDLETTDDNKNYKSKVEFSSI